MDSIVRTVTIIPPTMQFHKSNQISNIAKRRVAAYARVSTDNEEQLSSYEAQVEYYTKYIKEHLDWEFVKVYSDEGKSGTSIKKRPGFQRMITDALDGKIDLIITKSISRFARNTVDSISTVRKLKEKGIEIYFEKEQIFTLDSKGELLITIMSSLAQDESRNISENTTWGKRKRFADGKVSMPFKRFLGYDRGEDGQPVINEEQALLVRRIFTMFINGVTPSSIAKQLTAENIPTPGGKHNWQAAVVESILTNEKYQGDALLQKTFCTDYLTKKMKVNEGEVPQYYVEDSHPAIISKDVFAFVQLEIQSRKKIGKNYISQNIFSGKIICGDCGGLYGRKIWHSNDKYRKVVWRCNNKYNKGKHCATPHLNEEAVKKAFVDAFNSLITNKEEILDTYEDSIEQIYDTTELKKELNKLNNQLSLIEKTINTYVSENARQKLDQEEYVNRYNQLVTNHEEIQNGRKHIMDEITLLKNKKLQFHEYLKCLKEQTNLINEFDEDIWCSMISNITVKSDKEFVFRFKDESELVWTIK